MSAATAVDELSWSPGAPRSHRPTHLRLVRAHPGRPSCRRKMRLTRRGRLAVTLSAAVVLVTIVAGMTGLLPAGAAAPGRVHVVAPGQTLSEVAATTLPQLPLDRAIVRLQLANDLNTLHVQAGQPLLVPQP